MKLLVPTNDGINISPDFDRATSFRFLKVKNGIIKEDKLMNSPDSERNGLSFIVDKLFKKSDNKTEGYEPELSQIVIARQISEVSEANLLNHNFKVFHSVDTNVLNAIMSCIRDYSTRESDYCCCP